MPETFKNITRIDAQHWVEIDGLITDRMYQMAKGSALRMFLFGWSYKARAVEEMTDNITKWEGPK